MRFQFAHKLVTYLLALATLAALAGTRALSSVSATSFAIACALSFAVDPGSRVATAIDRRATLVRGLALVVFATLTWRVWRRLPDSDFRPAVDLGLALLAIKLYFRRSHRDYVHILAFSSLLVLVASTLAASFVFVVAFFAFAVLAVWALILFHLRREMEENYLVKHSAQAPSQKVGVGRILGSRRVVGRTFFVATGGVAIVVVAGAVAIFMAVPRFGAGFVLGAPIGAGDAAADDEVSLGRYGTRAAAAHAVVLRATISELTALPGDDARRRAAEALYFRGAVYDSYERGRWTRGRLPELRTLVIEEQDDDGRHRFVVRELADAAAPTGPMVRQEIEVVGSAAAMLPALDRPLAFELPAARLGAAGRLRVSPRWSGEAALRLGGGDGFVSLAHAHYVAFSSDAPAPSATLPDVVRAAYLALPPGVGQRVAGLANELSASGPFDDTRKITRVVERLRAGHAYSLDPPPARRGSDPVEDFLFSGASGHCELFASAAVLMLRASGIPARYVTGFRGGDWNALGEYVSVRDDRAHAWAEAFIPGLGWTRVDATPAGPAPAQPGRVAQAMDALDRFWTRWVVGYDSPRQRDLAERAGRRLGPLGAVAPGRRPGALVGWLAAAAALAGALVLAARAWRRRARERAGSAFPGYGVDVRSGSRRSAIEVLYRRTLKRLGRAGWPRRFNETPHEYADRVRAAGLYPDGDFDQLTERYGAARFGTEAVAESALADLAAKLASAPQGSGHPGTGGPHARA